MNKDIGWHVTEFLDPEEAEVEFKRGKEPIMLFHQHMIHRKVNEPKDIADFFSQIYQEQIATKSENAAIIRAKLHYEMKDQKPAKKLADKVLKKLGEEIVNLKSWRDYWEFFRPENAHFHPEGRKALCSTSHYNPLTLQVQSTMAVIAHHLVAEVTPDLKIDINSNGFEYFTEQLKALQAHRTKVPDTKYYNLVFTPWYEAAVPAEFVDSLLAYPWEERHGEQMKRWEKGDARSLASLARHPNIVIMH